MTQFQTQTLIDRRPRWVVQLKVNWYDEDWTTVNYLEPAVFSNAISPVIPFARFTWHVGEAMRVEVPAGQGRAFRTYKQFPDGDDLAHAFLESKLAGVYVRIGVLVPATRANRPGTFQQKWIGVIVSSSEARAGYKNAGQATEIAQGLQTIEAFGLAYLLDKRPIEFAYCVNRDLDVDGYSNPITADETIAQVGWAPDFNRTAGRGGVVGNKSDPPLEGAPFDGMPGRDPLNFRTHLNAFAGDYGAQFSIRDRVWTDQEKVRYLIWFHQPRGNADWQLIPDDPPPDDPPPRDLQFVTMTAERLIGQRTVTRQEGRTVADIFNELAHADLGLAWSVECPDAESPDAVAEVKFHSRFRDPVNVGGVTVPGNSDRVDLVLADARSVVQAAVEESHRRKVDKVRVVGDRIVACFSVGFQDQTFVPGWTAAAAVAYKQAAAILRDGSTNPAYAALSVDDQAKLNDALRRSERFRGVFSRFRIPFDWDWEVGDGVGTLFPSNMQDVRITTLANGGLGFDPDDRYGWRHHQRRILKWIPLLEGIDYADPTAWDYTGTIPGTEIPTAVPGLSPAPPAGAELRGIYVVLKDPNETDTPWVDATRGVKDAGRPSVRVVNDDFAFEVQFNPPHLSANNDSFLQGASLEPTAFPPDQVQGIDYETDLVATIAIETDDRLTVEEFVNPGIPPVDFETLTIQVPGAAAWWIAPNTVVGIESDGTLKRTPAGTDPTGVAYARGVVRNDVAVLRAVAAVAKAWYGVERYNLVIATQGKGIQGVSPYGAATPGQLISKLDPTFPAELEVNAIVSQVVFNNTAEPGIVTLYAGSAAVDPVVIASRGF